LAVKRSVIEQIDSSAVFARWQHITQNKPRIFEVSKHAIYNESC